MTTDKDIIQKHTSAVPRFAPLLIVALSVSLLFLVLFQRFAPLGMGRPGVDLVQATQAFIPGQAMTITDENVTIYVPKDSVNLPGTISIASREPNLFPVAAQPEWTRPQVIEVLFLNTQGTPVPNIVFANPAQVCFKLTPQQWKDFTKRTDAYQVQYYAVENNPRTWQTLPMATDSSKSLLCGQTTHFSIFSLAIRQDAGIPVTGLTLTPTLSSAATRERRVPEQRDVPPAGVNTSIPVPTQAQPTNPPPTPVPTDVPPTEPPPTEPPPTEPPPATEPAPTEGGGLPIPPILPTLGP